MLAIDKDLRDAGAAAGAADHLVAPARLFHQVDFGELDTLALKERPRPRAIGTPHCAVHLDLGHRAASPAPVSPARYGAASIDLQSRGGFRKAGLEFSYRRAPTAPGVKTPTHSAPARRNTRAHSSAVAPVVIT